MKIKLPQVTLVCLTGINYKTAEHAEAIRKSCEGIEFGDVKIIQLGSITDIDSWNKAVIQELYKYVNTSHALLIHEDSEITNPELWNPDWMYLDFIGAPWPLPQDDYSYLDEEGDLQRVGNSVSLRSTRLMRLAAMRPWKAYYGNFNEDGFICCHNRKWLESQHCKFATLEQAVHFSKEHTIPENEDIETFCFHQL